MIDLTTTNVLLGIMAVVSLLEAIALIAAGVMGLKLYRQLNEQVRLIEDRHVKPLSAQAANISAQAATILQTAQRIAERVEHRAHRVDTAVENTMHTAEAAVDRVQGGVRKTAGTMVGVVRGVRTAIETFLTDGPSPASRTAPRGPYDGPTTGSAAASDVGPGPDADGTPAGSGVRNGAGAWPPPPSASSH